METKQLDNDVLKITSYMAVIFMLLATSNMKKHFDCNEINWLLSQKETQTILGLGNKAVIRKT